MKITRDTKDILIVEDRPWLFGLMIIVFILVFVGVGLAMVSAGELWGLLFALAGGGLGGLGFVMFVRRVQVVFHGPEGWVEIRRKSVFATSRLRHLLSEIGHATIEESHGGDSGPTYRVTLVIPKGQSKGRHPLTLTYSNVGDHHGVAARINGWLDSHREAP